MTYVQTQVRCIVLLTISLLNEQCHWSTTISIDPYPEHCQGTVSSFTQYHHSDHGKQIFSVENTRTKNIRSLSGSLV